MRSEPARPYAPGAHRSGFTLTELLVVIAVIAILASLLLPSLSDSKAASQRVQCLSNLRQMAIAADLYVDDCAGFYPIAYYYGEQDGVNCLYAWDLTTVEGSPNTVIPGVLWEGRTTLQIQQCPSFDGGADWLTDPYSGYKYNTSYIGHGQYESIPEPAKGSDVLHASRTALFGDGQYASGADKFMRAPWPNPGDEDFVGRWSGTQGFRHQQPQQRRLLRRPCRIPAQLLCEQFRRLQQCRVRHGIPFARQLNV